MSDSKDNSDLLAGGHTGSAGGLNATPEEPSRGAEHNAESSQGLSAARDMSLWAWLYSPGLTLWLLGLMIVAMALGTIVPQGASVGAYERAFGVALGRLVAKSSLTHVFTAWWFSLLFVLLAVNLTACVVRRVRIVARAQDAAASPLTSAQVRGRCATAAWSIKLAPAAAYDQLARVLRTRGYHLIPAPAGAKDEMALRARRGAIRSWGPIIVHAGLVVVALGAACGRLPSLAFHRTAVIASGDTYRVAMGEKSFGIRLLDAGIERTPGGGPSQYWARTQIVEHGKVIRNVTITPNHPLRYHGANVVLDSLFDAPGYAVEVKKGKSVGCVPVVMDSSGRVDMMSSVTSLKDPPWLVWVRGFRAAPAGEPGAEGGPAALVRLDESGAVTANRREIGWVGAGGLDYHGVHFELVCAHGSKGVRLGVHRDPGVPVVWSGFGLIVLGCLLALFVTRREIAATLAPNGGAGTAVVIGASAFGLGPGAESVLDSLGADLEAREQADRE